MDIDPAQPESPRGVHGAPGEGPRCPRRDGPMGGTRGSASFPAWRCRTHTARDQRTRGDRRRRTGRRSSRYHPGPRAAGRPSARSAPPGPEADRRRLLGPGDQRTRSAESRRHAGKDLDEDDDRSCRAWSPVLDPGLFRLSCGSETLTLKPGGRDLGSGLRGGQHGAVGGCGDVHGAALGRPHRVQPPRTSGPSPADPDRTPRRLHPREADDSPTQDPEEPDSLRAGPVSRRRAS